MKLGEAKCTIQFVHARAVARAIRKMHNLCYSEYPELEYINTSKISEDSMVGDEELIGQGCLMDDSPAE